jgi:hypothetical protein
VAAAAINFLADIIKQAPLGVAIFTCAFTTKVQRQWQHIGPKDYDNGYA